MALKIRILSVAALNLVLFTNLSNSLKTHYIRLDVNQATANLQQRLFLVLPLFVKSSMLCKCLDLYSFLDPIKLSQLLQITPNG